MHTDEYLTKKEVAAFYKVSENTVSMWLWKRKLPYFKACGRTLIARADLYKFLKPGGGEATR
jgi:excisionase family DNA binding protein